MVASQINIMILIAVLIVLALVAFVMRMNKKVKPLTPLTSVAFIFIFMGIIFNDSNRWLTYSLFGVGIILAILDIIMRKK